jgi:hypothetical protein
MPENQIDHTWSKIKIYIYCTQTSIFHNKFYQQDVTKGSERKHTNRGEK